MAYARHQSFYLRDKWISKGLKAIIESPRFFYEDDSPEEIGLGKNMVQSLRFWMLATEIIYEDKSNKQTEHYLTELGNLIYHKDRLLQKNDTVSILHYHLVRNKDDLATVFNWYFNNYKETITQRDILLKTFTTWVNNNDKSVSPKSLKRDIDCLVQLYTKKSEENDPEDFIFSPFTKLNLIKEEQSEEGYGNVRKVTPELNDIGLVSLFYVLLKYGEENEVNLVSLDEILNEDFLWGKVFNLSRNRIIEILNKLTNHSKFSLQYVRTNNLDNVRLPNISSFEYLSYEYGFSLDRVTV
ncbi:DUF4007 family protein [Metabacillus halosaccharovorans]|uniref:DUF4007 family protein n=1 Tax=Metabacillus halosaccharovorans TaxID=930124 RepID=A0ABT3DDI3_9BACI|nr:DUF4007 family protein [Metabacillus halosaccharovorans]MCV9885123.1 DUF4007 family protein [Metabacillus halosaccharovorans]